MEFGSFFAVARSVAFEEYFGVVAGNQGEGWLEACLLAAFNDELEMVHGLNVSTHAGSEQAENVVSSGP